MGNLFLANPDVLKAEGDAVTNQGEQFDQKVKTIYSTLDEMLSSNYLSPAAREIGARIRAKKEDLDAMTEIIKQYGSYCSNAGNTVIRNEQNIMDNLG